MKSLLLALLLMFTGTQVLANNVMSKTTITPVPEDDYVYIIDGGVADGKATIKNVFASGFNDTEGYVPVLNNGLFIDSTIYDNGTNVGIGTSSPTQPLDVNGAITATVFTGDVTGDLTGNADTATALAANGANCSSGNSPLGVDASGAVESCFDVWTEAENTSAGYIANVVEDTTPQLGGNLDLNTNTITGFTASRALETDVSGNLQVSAVTSTELNYLDGVTSAIQTQIDNKQPLDAGLTSISGLTTAADRMIYTTASDTYAVATLTSAGRSILDDASTSAIRTTLGVGTAQSPQFNAVNIGNATDTTVARASAGVISVEGVTVPTISSTSTLTNKTIDGDNNTLSNLDIGNEVDWAAATDVADRSAFASGDKLLIFEDGVGMRKVDYDDLPGAGGGLLNVVEDTTPQLGGDLDVNGNKIVSVTNGNIDIEPNGTGNVLLGNFTFDADQTVGAGQDDYVLTYDNAGGLISLEASAGGGEGGDFNDTEGYVPLLQNGLFEDSAIYSDPTTTNVGIGTTSPTDKLDVDGNVTMTGLTVTGLVSCDTIDTDANGVLSCGTDNAGGGSGVLNDTDGYIPVLNNADFIDSTIYDDGTNVGIGASSPNQKLEVSGNIRSSGYYQMFGGGANAFFGLGTLISGGLASDFAIRQNNAGGNILFAPAGNTEKMRLTSDGFLGIGIDSPEALLHVDNGNVILSHNTGGHALMFDSGDVAHGMTFGGIIPTDRVARILADSGAGLVIQGFYGDGTKPAFRMQGHTGSTSPTESPLIFEAFKKDGTTGRTALGSTERAFTFYNGAYDGSGTNVLTLLGGGNVGIGTTAPASKLEVEGEVDISGISGDGTGKAVCIKSNGDLGTCSNVVGVSGTCTCG